MPELNEGVQNPENPPISEKENQEVVNEDLTTQPPVEPTQQEAEGTATPPVESTPPTEDAFDDMGVPWKNRAAEERRKREELVDKLPQLIGEEIRKSVPQSGRKYDPAQLRAFASETDNAQSKQWALQEAARIEREADKQDTIEAVRSEIKKWDDKRTSDNQRKESLTYAMTAYPEMFNKNQAGQITGWNNNHAMTKLIGQLMLDPELKKNPRGLMVAADIAYARISRQTGNSAVQQNTQLKKEVKSLQKNTLVEGGGSQGVQTRLPHQVALENLKKTGSIKDATEAIKHISALHKKSKQNK